MARLCVYIAGPYRSRTIEGLAANMRRGIDLAAEVIQAGFAPEVPWLDFDLLLTGRVTVEQLQEVSMAKLAGSDAMLLAPYWMRSVGTLAEVRWSVANGKPIFNYVADVRSYFAGHGEPMVFAEHILARLERELDAEPCCACAQNGRAKEGGAE